MSYYYGYDLFNSLLQADNTHGFLAINQFLSFTLLKLISC